MDIDDDVPLAKIAKGASNQNKMLRNMENILNECNPSFSLTNKTIQFDPNVPDPNLEMCILVDADAPESGPQMTPVKAAVALEPTKSVKHIPEIPQEYEWPQRSGEFFILKESLAKFLDIPDNHDSLSSLEVRDIDTEEEKNYIMKIGIVKILPNKVEVVRNEDAFQFLCENNKAKFHMYIEGVHTREMRKLVEKQEAQRSEVIKGNVSRVLKRTLQETVKYNSRLNSERKESRQAYFDLQAQIIHLPQKKPTYDPDRKSNFSRYPLALLPGQYQDYFKVFSSEELKTLPLQTITSFPCAKRLQEPESEETLTADETAEEKDGPQSPTKKESAAATAVLNSVQPDKDPFCGICMKGPEMNKRGLPEKLIHCYQCVNSGHPSCLDMNRHLVMVIKSYPWQCMECKVCTECLAPHDEEEMIFCDNCDRGYHSYCVGLKEIPKGRWVCSRCGKCASCLDVYPVPEGASGRWKTEYSKPKDESEPEFLQVHCHGCSKLFRKGAFCPVCLKVYRTDEDHINPMVCCDECDRWIHTDCDGIDDQRYMELSKDSKSSYTCILCRGEKEERMDSFHKKFR